MHIGTGRQPPASLRLENTTLGRADGITQLINGIKDHRRLDVAITATANSGDAARRRARDASDFVHATAVAVVPNTAVTAGPVTMQQLDPARPFGRLAVAALLGIFAIVAADALFLTRTRLVSPYVRETARERHARRKTERRARAEERAGEHRPPTPVPRPAPAPAPARAQETKPEPKAKPKPRPRARPKRQTHVQPRRRVDAKPLDLPNIEVHLMDKEGGLRAVELRDAAHEPEGRD